LDGGDLFVVEIREAEKVPYFFPPLHFSSDD